MKLAEKLEELKAARTALLKKAKKAQKKLEAELEVTIGKNRKNLTEVVESWTGRYYAIVGPILKEAKRYEDAINLISNK